MYFCVCSKKHFFDFHSKIEFKPPASLPHSMLELIGTHLPTSNIEQGGQRASEQIWDSE
jgi:hypothetical protein